MHLKCGSFLEGSLAGHEAVLEQGPGGRSKDRSSVPRGPPSWPAEVAEVQVSGLSFYEFWECFSGFMFVPEILVANWTLESPILHLWNNVTKRGRKRMTGSKQGPPGWLAEVKS